MNTKALLESLDTLREFLQWVFESKNIGNIQIPYIENTLISRPLKGVEEAPADEDFFLNETECNHRHFHWTMNRMINLYLAQYRFTCSEDETVTTGARTFLSERNNPHAIAVTYTIRHCGQVQVTLQKV